MSRSSSEGFFSTGSSCSAATYPKGTRSVPPSLKRTRQIPSRPGRDQAAVAAREAAHASVVEPLVKLPLARVAREELDQRLRGTRHRLPSLIMLLRPSARRHLRASLTRSLYSPQEIQA